MVSLCVFLGVYHLFIPAYFHSFGKEANGKINDPQTQRQKTYFLFNERSKGK